MPPAPATTASPPPKSGKKTLGMTQPQLLIVLGIALAGGAFILYRRRKAAASAPAGTSTGTGSCADGSAPDANGNCPQASQDFSGQLATLQQELADLQASGGAGSAGGGIPSGGDAGGTGGSTGTGSGGDAGGTPLPPAPLPGGGTPPPVTRYPAPTGLAARAESGTQAVISWNPVNPPAPNYTLAVYQLNGKQVHQGTVGSGGTGRITTSVSGLRAGYQYQVHVWANGGTTAPAHASAMLTMPKK